MFPAIIGVAISAFCSSQSLALVAGRRLIFLRFLRTPPRCLLLAPGKVAIGDMRVAWITGSNAGIATRTGVVPAMLGANQLTAVVAARHGFGMADVAWHSE